MDVFRDKYHFWRYELQLPLAKDQDQEVTYSWGDPNGVGPFTFHVPALLESMRFMFYSCSGFSDIPQEEKQKCYYGRMSWIDMLWYSFMYYLEAEISCTRTEDFMQPWRDDPAQRSDLLWNYHLL